MKRILQLSLILMLFLVYEGYAQDRTIVGTITSTEDNTPLPGVTITAKGNNTIGTVTDSDGKYSLSVPSEVTTLIVSYIGMTTQEVAVGARTTIDVALAPDTEQLTEVVVTAQGIERSQKSLGYSSTTVRTEELTRASNRSALDALQGKVAGVNITSASGAPGASTRVIMRGFSSLTNTNQPLYVVDGVPVDNASINSSSIPGSDGTTDALNGAVDFGNRVNDINPEDIESVTVLKGTSGTALYGSRAANGVILITTKKGKDAANRNKKAEISVSSSVTFDRILKTPTYQNEYGQGFFGNYPQYLDENTSWGARLDGEERLWGRVIDNSQKLQKYEALENNVKDFFETGTTYNNSVSLSGGDDKLNYYLSYGNVDQNGIMPTDADSYKRNTLSARGQARLSNKVTTSVSANYVNTKQKFVPTGQGSSVLNNVWQTPRNISLLEVRDYKDKFNDIEGFYSPFTVNPWFALGEFGNRSATDRIFGNAQIAYDFNDWINLNFRVGTDVSSQQLNQWEPVARIVGANSARSSAGKVTVSNINRREINSDLILTINRNFGENFGFKALLGNNINQRGQNILVSEVNNLVIPGFYDLSNTSAPAEVVKDDFMRRLVGVYASFDLSYKDFLFLTVQGRNDWSSTLPKNNRSFFYPAANLSFVFTDALGLNGTPLSFGKVRFGWAQTGNDAPPYQVNAVFPKGNFSDGFTDINFPLSNEIPGFERGNRIGNPNLQPEITTEFEIGTDLRFFNNRAGIDFAWYNKTVTELIVDVDISFASGYSTQTLNLGKLTNKGIELLVRGTPIQTNNFSWDLSVNFTRNRNKLEELLPNLNRVALGNGGTTAISIVGRVGQPLALIEGSVPLKDDQGRYVVDAAGEIRTNPEKQILGNTQYDYIAGVTNQLSYKGLSLTATFDIRQGGIMFTRTADIGHFAGTAPQTLYNDRRPFIVPNSVYQPNDEAGNPIVDDQGNPVYVENTTPITSANLHDFWGGGGFEKDKAFTMSKSFVKLREVALTYSLPKRILDKTPFGNIQVGIIGRNLLLWVPSSNVWSDPEQVTMGNDIEADYGDFGATPTTRSLGGNLRFTF